VSGRIVTIVVGLRYRR